ncbi:MULTISPECIES: molybdenum cofactor guanylyltransferase MobA [Photobacterium]|uniref:molybdenum cofactor guanylyltransferase MobA n=1 Tax=Photobacterium TaxID=657 RepID=UPI000EA30696|nr:molybdenum cofactor guanylyltransferase MobA [Photobacterium salinisoli]
MTLTPPSFSVLLLAGGQGSRMGGKDKGLVSFRGRPLIASLFDVVRPLTDDLLISCNRNTDQYARYCDHILTDDISGFPGPLTGILKGLAAAKHDWLLLFPCDAPMIDQSLVRQLLDAASADMPRPAMIRQGSQWQPMFSLIPKRLLPALQQAWHSGERSLMAILTRHQVVAVDCALNDPRLQNINTAQQLLDLHHD